MPLTRTLSLALVALPSLCAAQDAVAPPTAARYELDMFSLVSFGLAIAALVLSLFMAWLSWQFYAKSTQTADKTNETVTKIEVLVAGIQSNITEIVQRTVSHWIESGSGDGEISQNKLDVYDKLSELESAIQKSGGGDAESLLKEVAELRCQFEDLGRSIRESRAKTLFPNVATSTQVVEYSQENISTDDDSQSGLIRVAVLRPTKVATATIKFSPYFDDLPKIDTKLISSPYEDESQISAKAGSPSTKGCNVHLNCTSPLKLGEYVFEFCATTR